MNAFVLHGIDDLRYEQTDTPEIREGWALVEVMAAGICASDIPRIFELGTYQFPTIPGHEFSGIVRQVGVAEDKALIGKRVGVYPLIPCRECDNCRREQYELCKSYDYLGSRRNGCFAEYVAIPVWNLIELPDEVSFAEAAMLEPMAAALHALRRLPLSEIKSIVIFGADFMSLLTAQWARLLGISDVFIVGQKVEQCELASELGFQRICCTQEQDAIEWLHSSTRGTMVDAAIEGIGSGESLMKCIQSVHANGYIVSAANPCENITLEQDIYWKILRKQIKLVGAWNSRFSSSTEDDWKDSVEMLLARRIDTVSLVTHDYPFRDLIDGLRLMRDESEFYGKILLNKSSKTRMVYR
ncbi:MAG TPA: galactitol-1-phosphate 5-dehydrogenase [Lachnospiraceae bacterium]|nr:galactitol-1-phosphate 5-dehydrogenase [Lachnospiraceae bacterium]